MINFLHYAVAFAVVLGVLIVVHEFGHYAVARLCGVKVLRFSVGFGRPLWSRRLGRDGTEWVLAAFPLGGYVKMLDEREAAVPSSERHRAFNTQPVGKRMAIVAAGPVANLLLAVFLYTFVFWQGAPELRALLGTPPAASALAEAGLENGEEVLRIDGREVVSLQDLHWQLLSHAGETDVAVFETRNLRGELNERRVRIAPTLAEYGLEADFPAKLGVTLFRPRIPPRLGLVEKLGVAAVAGLRQGDLVTAVGGVAVETWEQVVAAVRAAPGRPLDIAVLRDGRQLNFSVRPVEENVQGQQIGRIGVGVALPADLPELATTVRYPLAVSLQRAVRETWEKSCFSLTMLGKMLVGQVSLKNLSGPVTIADFAGQSAKLGWASFLKFMGLVSISLGVLNLLPIPVLDGGHLMYHMLELLRKRPVSEHTLEVGQRIGLSLLFALMAFALYNDFARLASG